MNDMIAAVLFCTVASLTPGPNNFMLLNSGLQFGTRRSLGHLGGIAIGFPIMVIAVALGLGAFLVSHPHYRLGLQIVGSIYMLYLAYKISQSTASGQGKTAKQPMTFLQAALFQWVNPKAWLMIVSSVAIFHLHPDFLTNALLLTFIYFIVTLPCLGAWLLLGASLQKVLRTEKHRHLFNQSMAIALVISVVMAFFE